jgi:hypothetical protein
MQETMRIKFKLAAYGVFARSPAFVRTCGQQVQAPQIDRCKHSQIPEKERADTNLLSIS